MPTDVAATATGVRPNGARTNAAADAGRVRLQLDAVNGWRGPGALAIAVAHLGVATDFFAYSHLEPAAPLVDLFFVLSGLVIAQAYGAKLTRATAIPEYVIRRFGRIWPVQAATLLLLVGYETFKLIALKVTDGHFSSPPFARSGLYLPEAIPTNLLLIQSLGIHDRETWNYPSWSLSVEFVTYVGFAAVCLVKPSMRRVLSVVVIVVSVLVLADIAPYGMRSTYDFGIFRCLAGFFVGTLCYDLATHWPPPKPRYPTLVEFGTVGFTVVWLFVSARTALALAAPIVFGVFVLVFINGKGLLSRLLSSKSLQIFAELSFSIYMVHTIVLIVILVVVHAVARWQHLDLFVDIANPLAGLPGAPSTINVVHVDNTVLRWLLVAIYLAGVIAASWLAFVIVEIPGRRFFSRLGAKVAPPPRRSQGHEIARTGAEELVS